MSYKGYLIDLDGTIYLGEKPILAGVEWIKHLQKNEVPYLFVTNNTTKSPYEVQKKLKSLCGLNVPESAIYTASLATVDYMKQTNLGNSVYVIGEIGLKQAIYGAGFVEDTNHPAYVVVGLDTEITYDKLVVATLAIQKGAKFIATNPDKNIPTHQGLLPGAGSLVASLEASTQKEATYIGKPKAIMMNRALEILSLEAQEVLMVGDNYETDIRAGIDNGIDSLLVLTGFTKKEEVSQLPVPPTYVVNSLAEWQG